jgi:hypothetical protein
MNTSISRVHLAVFLATVTIVPSQLLGQASVGLSTLHSQLLENHPIAEWPPLAGDGFGRAVAGGDFNGDGFDDLAVGIPYHDGRFEISANSGIVAVRYGSPIGLQASALSLLRLTIPQDNAFFGSALAAGDFDNDGFDDLAVGVPGFDFNCCNQDVAMYGKVMVHMGSQGGLEEIGSIQLDSRGFGDPNQRFGHTLAVGDFNGDHYDDLAIGSPFSGRFLGGAYVPGGSVTINHGPNLVGAGDNWFEITQLAAEIPGTFEAGDLFGFALAAGNFNGDASCGAGGCADFDDLAIGVPGEDGATGKLLVLFGSQSSLLFGSHNWWSEGDLGGTTTPSQFGHALAAGDFDGDNRDDLAVGSPYKTVNGAAAAGQTTILFGSTSFIDGTWFDLASTRWLTQTSFYGAAANAADDRFGYSLAPGDFDNDGRDDLAVGHIGEAIIPGGISLGGFSVLTGSQTNPRGPGRAFRFFGAGYAGMPIGWNYLDYFGSILATGDFNGDLHDDLAVGVPNHDVAGIGVDVGAAALLYGALFADGFEWNGSLIFWSQVVP